MTAAASAQHCFLSASSLFHCVTGRCRLAAIKSAEPWSVCPPPSILESDNRSICDESKPDIVVKVGQTPFHQAPAQKKFFFLQTPENICLKEKATKPKFQGQSEVSRMQLEL